VRGGKLQGFVVAGVGTIAMFGGLVEKNNFALVPYHDFNRQFLYASSIYPLPGFELALNVDARALQYHLLYDLLQSLVIDGYSEPIGPVDLLSCLFAM
jgi:hypothetical protein